MFPFVPDIVPSVLQALAVVTAFCYSCATPLRRHPAPFYLVFAGGALLKTLEGSLPLPPAAQLLVNALASSYTGVAFYLVVMFAGALDKRKPWVKTLLSVRSELSIIGGFIIFAHCVRVAFMPFLALLGPWDAIWGEASLPMFLAIAIIGPALTVCFLVPWVTSFRFIRSKMSHARWKKIQRLAYPFMALMLAQGCLLAVGHAVYVWHHFGSYASPEVEFAKYVLTAATYFAFAVAYACLKAKGASQTAEKTRADIEAS